MTVTSLFETVGYSLKLEEADEDLRERAKRQAL